ncbi:MAG TPA: hypothetical protein VM915_05485, partial [Verrucomicrobiae bacterium]|nr:hypothetical protein [Verrucomicrobiae bacterium]
MRIFVYFIAALAVIGVAHAQTPPPVEAFGRLPVIADAAMSPDGSKVAMIATDEDGAAAIVVHDLDRAQRVFGVMGPREGQLRGVGWASDTQVSFLISRAVAPGAVLPFNMRYRGAPSRVEFWRNGIADLETERVRLLSTSDEVWEDRASELIAPIEGDPGMGRMIGRAQGQQASHPTIYRVRFDGGNAQVVAPRGVNRDTIDFLLDARGQTIARIDSDERTNRWSIFVYDGEIPRLLMQDTSATGDPLSLVGALPDGRLVAVDEGEGEFFALHAIDRTTGAREVLFQREGIEVDGIIRDPWTREIVGAAWIEEEARQEFFDPALRAAQQHIQTLFQGGVINVISWSRDRRRLLLYGERSLDGGAYYYHTVGEDRVVRLSHLYPQVAEARIGERQSITYRARDGVRVPAYLTLPRGGA